MRFRALIEERANEIEWRHGSRQQAHSCDSSALQKEMVLFKNLLGKRLSQEINGDRVSI